MNTTVAGAIIVSAGVAPSSVQDDIHGILEGLAKPSKRQAPGGREFTVLGSAYINTRAAPDWEEITNACGGEQVEALLLEQRTDTAIEFAWLKVRDVISVLDQVRRGLNISGSRAEFFESVHSVENNLPRLDGRLDDLAEFAFEVSQRCCQHFAACFSYCGCNGTQEEIAAFLMRANELQWSYRADEEKLQADGSGDRARSRVLAQFYSRFGIPKVPQDALDDVEAR